MSDWKQTCTTSCNCSNPVNNKEHCVFAYGRYYGKLFRLYFHVFMFTDLKTQPFDCRVLQTLIQLNKLTHAKSSPEVSQVHKRLSNWALRELNTAPSGPHQYCLCMSARGNFPGVMQNSPLQGLNTHFMQHWTNSCLFMKSKS